jgi:hypothetical protein
VGIIGFHVHTDELACALSTSDQTAPRSSRSLFVRCACRQSHRRCHPAEAPIHSRCRGNRRAIATPDPLLCGFYFSVSRQSEGQIGLVCELALVEYLVHVPLYDIRRPYGAHQRIPDLLVVGEHKDRDGLVKVDICNIVLLVKVLDARLWDEGGGRGGCRELKWLIIRCLREPCWIGCSAWCGARRSRRGRLRCWCCRWLDNSILLGLRLHLGDQEGYLSPRSIRQPFQEAVRREVQQVLVPLLKREHQWPVACRLWMRVVC